MQGAVRALEIPATVQPLLAARIDRLPEREKHLLQTAAVIGRRFSEPLLAQVAELPEQELVASLGVLQSAEFILAEALYPLAEYAFKHPLTEQVARESCPRNSSCCPGIGKCRSVPSTRPQWWVWVSASGPHPRRLKKAHPPHTPKFSIRYS